MDDVVAQRMPIEDFALQLPDGHGLGVEVDLNQLARFDRARADSQPRHFDLGSASA